MSREYVGVAVRALTAHKFRSLLTVSTITLGAFSIVFMSSLATSGLTTLVRDIESLGGARLILIMPKIPERVPDKGSVSPGRFTPGDREALFQALPFTTARTMFGSFDRTDAQNPRGDFMRTDLVGADAAFFDALNLRLEHGRSFTEDENRQRARVCVVGYEVAQKLYGGRAVGRWSTVDGRRCRIIGQVAKVDHWDVSFGFEWLNFVAIPLETIAETRPEVRSEVHLQIQTEHVSKNDIVKRIANAILVDRHGGVDDYWIWDLSAAVKRLKSVFAVMEAVVGLIAGIALLVGGIGVMNMMLVSVSERTREIGVRRALGASPAAISTQFLYEAMVLSGMGGILGAVLGVLAAVGANTLVRRLQPVWVGEISTGAVGVAVLVSVLIGLGFGFFPARRASRLDPVEALRR